MLDCLERAQQTPNEGSVPTHFCLVHSTSVALTTLDAIEFNPAVDELELIVVEHEDSYTSSIFHPPPTS